MGITPIFRKSSKLVLPKLFSFGKHHFVPFYHFFYQGKGNMFISAPSLRPIVVAQTTLSMLDFLFVVRVAGLELSLGLSNILTLALFTSSKVYQIATITIHFLSDGVDSLSICTLKLFGIFNHRTGMAIVAF